LFRWVTRSSTAALPASSTRYTNGYRRFAEAPQLWRLRLKIDHRARRRPASFS
jgi:hypothetical protein